jgi:hypothetical protein
VKLDSSNLPQQQSTAIHRLFFENCQKRSRACCGSRISEGSLASARGRARGMRSARTRSAGFGEKSSLTGDAHCSADHFFYRIRKWYVYLLRPERLRRARLFPAQGFSRNRDRACALARGNAAWSSCVGPRAAGTYPNFAGTLRPRGIFRRCAPRFRRLFASPHDLERANLPMAHPKLPLPLKPDVRPASPNTTKEAGGDGAVS